MDQTTLTSIPQEETCQVVQQAAIVLNHAKNLRTSMNQMRRLLITCNTCPKSGDCPALQEYNRQIDAALNQVTAEWGLV